MNNKPDAKYSGQSTWVRDFKKRWSETVAELKKYDTSKIKIICKSNEVY